MKIALASDLHLEFGDCFLKNTENADVLILSGDIMIAQDLHDHPQPANEFDRALIAKGQGYGRRQQAAQMYRDFLSRCSVQFPHTIYVAGNHEFYHGKWSGSLQDLRNECQKYPNVYFMENDCKVINDVLFMGASLWTDCNKGDPLTLHTLQDFMNDYRMIRNDDLGYTKLRPAHTLSRHRQTMSYFKKVLEDVYPGMKTVVVGHHAPSSQSIHEMYRHQTVMNGAYFSDLSEFILDHPEIVLWTHGHTHFKFDYMIGDCRVVCNPRGYVGYEPQAEKFELQYLDI
jgi:predicted phosphodiesterase